MKLLGDFSSGVGGGRRGGGRHRSGATRYMWEVPVIYYHKILII